MDDPREILVLFRSGVISSVLRKFKELMKGVTALTDSLSKLLTFGLGLVEVFDD